MKRLLTVLVAVIVVFVFLVSSALAEDWKPTAEVAMGIHSGFVDQISGALLYNKAMSNQAVTLGLGKNDSGFYIQAENFAPFEKEEKKETNFYLGFYTEAAGMKFDAGYGHYWVREDGELDYHAIYAAIDFPAIAWQIVPFVKAEYNFAKKLSQEDESGNISETSMDGFMYYGGFKREFQIHKNVSLIAELGVGGNTGVYGMPAENLSFAREKIDTVISLAEWCKFQLSVLTQQNLGLREGIATETDKLFMSVAMIFYF